MSAQPSPRKACRLIHHYHGIIITSNSSPYFFCLLQCAYFQVPRHDSPRPSNRQRDPSTTKVSFRSPTPSSLADDENSLSSLYRPQSMENSHEIESASDEPLYPGEDTRMTSRKELSGWYSYGWAAEVFVICGVGITARDLAT